MAAFEIRLWGWHWNERLRRETIFQCLPAAIRHHRLCIHSSLDFLIWETKVSCLQAGGCFDIPPGWSKREGACKRERVTWIERGWWGEREREREGDREKKKKERELEVQSDRWQVKGCLSPSPLHCGDKSFFSPFSPTQMWLHHRSHQGKDTGTLQCIGHTEHTLLDTHQIDTIRSSDYRWQRLPPDVARSNSRQAWNWVEIAAE